MVFGVSETIWSLRNPKNAIFLCQNDVRTCKPPLLTYLRDITLIFTLQVILLLKICRFNFVKENWLSEAKNMFKT